MGGGPYHGGGGRNVQRAPIYRIVYYINIIFVCIVIFVFVSVSIWLVYFRHQLIQRMQKQQDNISVGSSLEPRSPFGMAWDSFWTTLVGVDWSMYWLQVHEGWTGGRFVGTQVLYLKYSKMVVVAEYTWIYNIFETTISFYHWSMLNHLDFDMLTASPARRRYFDKTSRSLDHGHHYEQASCCCFLIECFTCTHSNKTFFLLEAQYCRSMIYLCVCYMI